MVKISDGLRTLFHGQVERDGDRYVIEVPREGFAHNSLTAGTTYRVAILPATASGGRDEQSSPSPTPREQRGPPVEEGEIRELDIETIGDQGDGIAKVERGYVVIVPDAEPGETVTVEIESVQENVAFAQIRGGPLDD